MQSILHILRVNEPRSGTKDGRTWEMQDAECVIVDEAGVPQSVGVLKLPKDMRGVNAPVAGFYTGTFGLRPDMASRSITAVLLKLTPFEPRRAPK
jgi:hypothetical protein